MSHEVDTCRRQCKVALKHEFEGVVAIPVVLTVKRKPPRPVAGGGVIGFKRVACLIRDEDATGRDAVCNAFDPIVTVTRNQGLPLESESHIPIAEPIHPIVG